MEGTVEGEGVALLLERRVREYEERQRAAHRLAVALIAVRLHAGFRRRRAAARRVQATFLGVAARRTTLAAAAGSAPAQLTELRLTDLRRRRVSALHGTPRAAALPDGGIAGRPGLGRLWSTISDVDTPRGQPDTGVNGSAARQQRTFAEDMSGLRDASLQAAAEAKAAAAAAAAAATAAEAKAEAEAKTATILVQAAVETVTSLRAELLVERAQVAALRAEVLQLKAAASRREEEAVEVAAEAAAAEAARREEAAAAVAAAEDASDEMSHVFGAVEERFSVTLTRDEESGTLGVDISSWEGRVTVALVSGPAAAHGGIHAGDEIVGVGGVDYAEITEVLRAIIQSPSIISLQICRRPPVAVLRAELEMRTAAGAWQPVMATLLSIRLLRYELPSEAVARGAALEQSGDGQGELNLHHVSGLELCGMGGDGHVVSLRTGTISEEVAASLRLCLHSGAPLGLCCVAVVSRAIASGATIVSTYTTQARCSSYAAWLGWRKGRRPASSDCAAGTRSWRACYLATRGHSRRRRHWCGSRGTWSCLWGWMSGTHATSCSTGREDSWSSLTVPHSVRAGRASTSCPPRPSPRRPAPRASITSSGASRCTFCPPQP